MKEELLTVLLLKTRSIGSYDAAKDILWKKIVPLLVTLTTDGAGMIGHDYDFPQLFITIASFTSRRYVQK